MGPVAATKRPITVMGVAAWETSKPLVFSPRPSGTPKTHLCCHPYSRAVQDALVVVEQYVGVEAQVKFPQSLLSYRACEAHENDAAMFILLYCLPYRHIGVGLTLDPKCWLTFA